MLKARGAERLHVDVHFYCACDARLTPWRIFEIRTVTREDVIEDFGVPDFCAEACVFMKGHGHPYREKTRSG